MSRLAHHQTAVYTTLLAEQPDRAEITDALERGDITHAQAQILRRQEEIDMAEKQKGPNDFRNKTEWLEHRVARGDTLTSSDQAALDRARQARSRASGEDQK